MKGFSESIPRAREAYSDPEILKHIFRNADTDLRGRIAKARRSGHSPTAVLDYLVANPKAGRHGVGDAAKDTAKTLARAGVVGLTAGMEHIGSTGARIAGALTRPLGGDPAVTERILDESQVRQEQLDRTLQQTLEALDASGRLAGLAEVTRGVSEEVPPFLAASKAASAAESVVPRALARVPWSRVPGAQRVAGAAARVSPEMQQIVGAGARHGLVGGPTFSVAMGATDPKEIAIASLLFGGLGAKGKATQFSRARAARELPASMKASAQRAIAEVTGKKPPRPELARPAVTPSPEGRTPLLGEPRAKPAMPTVERGRMDAIAAKAAEPSQEFAGNTLFTQEMIDAARRRSKARGTQLRSGGPGTDEMHDWIIIGAGHFEKGARQFAAWSEKMIASAGERVRPHLKAIWKQARNTYQKEVRASALSASERVKRSWPGKGMPVAPETRTELVRIGNYYLQRGLKEGQWRRRMKRHAPGISDTDLKAVQDRVIAGERPPDDPGDKLARVLKFAHRLLPARKEAVHRLRQEQYREAQQAFSQYEGEEAAKRALAGMRGKAEVPEFESIRGDFSPADVQALFERIRTSQAFHKKDAFSRIPATTGLYKLLDGHEIPTASELAKLEAIFGTNLLRSMRKHISLGRKLGEVALDLANLPRSLVASIDLSASGRQGGQLMPRYRGAWKRAFREQLKVLLSERNMEELQRSIYTDPSYEIASRSGLYIAPWGPAASLVEREERFISRIADYVPGVKASNRAYVGMLNKLRMDAFKQYLVGNPTASAAEQAAYARFINYSTGRGALGSASKLSPYLSAVFFSPRYFTSRIQALAAVAHGPAPARKEAAKTLAAWLGTVGTTLWLADQVPGVDVEWDPRSTDSYKIRIGNTRFDVASGYQQFFRNAAQILTNKQKDTETEEVTSLGPGGSWKRFGKFGRSKLAPTAAFGVDAWSGRDYLNRPMEYDETSIKRMMFERLTPLSIQDVLDAYAEQGIPLTTGAGTAAVLGLGVQTYSRDNK